MEGVVWLGRIDDGLVAREVSCVAHVRSKGMDLTCPKCQAPMRSYERNGVTIEQCTECRGLFLDRGELERLTAAEDSFYGGAQGSGAPATQPFPEYPSGPARPRRQYGSPDSPDSPGWGRPDSRRGRRKSFLEGLFD